MAVFVMSPVAFWLVVIGLGVLIAATLPRLVSERPVSMPILLLALGVAVGFTPVDLGHLRPMAHRPVIEHLTELGVIVALMSAGLRINRPPRLATWTATTRLLSITMPLTIAAIALLGWQLAALAPASGVLLGAVLAPTDPVLASEVQAQPPGEVAHEASAEAGSWAKDDDEVRFALTSEAGLNDGLAFPFTHLALALVVPVGFATLARTWLLEDVLYRTAAAVVIGVVLATLLAVTVRAVPVRTQHATAIVGLAGLAGTLVFYGVTELAAGYGFVAVFVGAVVLRQRLRGHVYHVAMTVTTEEVERVFTALVLIGVGLAVTQGALAALTWPLVAVALAVVFLVRPLAGAVALVGHRRTRWPERLFISFFGIRGVGSLYYLAYATQRADFPGEEALWAVVLLVVVVSVLVHGATAAPLARVLARARPDS